MVQSNNSERYRENRNLQLTAGEEISAEGVSFKRGVDQMSVSYGALAAPLGARALEENIDGNGEGEKEALISAMPRDGKERRDALRKSIASVILVMAAIGLTIMSDVWRPSMLRSIGGDPTSLSKIKSTETNTLLVSSVSNEYGVRDSSLMLPYTFLVDALLVEPYKEATITLTDPLEGCSYDWYLTPVNDDTVVLSGASLDGSILVTLSTVGEYTFTAAESCGDFSDSSRSLTMSVWVKYVRRELSSLNDVDREEFLDAFHTLWTVSTSDGKTLYGSKYKSVNYFATLHNDGGGNPVCDEFHGGLGFLNNHMYLSAYLEQSLQLVNPRVALHYLEYNKYFETAAYKKHLNYQLDGGSWTEILSSKYFGASDPITGIITDGRWARAEIPYMTGEFMEEEGISTEVTFFRADEVAWLEKTTPHLNSPYGLLRSPWNYNPSPFVTRYGSVFRINDTDVIGDRDIVFKYHMGVTCNDYSDFFGRVNGNPLMTYLTEMEDDTHGIFHFTFGGVGGSPSYKAMKILMKDYGFSYSNVVAVAISAQPFFKKYLAVNKQIPVNCTAKPWQLGALTTTLPPGVEGGPSCDFADLYYTDEDSLNSLITFFFNIDPDNKDLVVNHLNTLSFEDKTAVMKIVGNMFPYDGDLAGSGAALDPLFWVAHGAMERTFQKSVFAGIFTDMTYDAYDKCSGHDYSTAKSWLEGYYFADETIKPQTLSNELLTSILDPTSDEYRNYVNFVYDTASFDWCDGSDAWFASKL